PTSVSLILCVVFPGYHTLCAVFAVRCLPHHTFLQYIDHRFLQLTETFVSRLMTGRCALWQHRCTLTKNIYHMWDHPVSSASISRDYVRTLLEKRNKTKEQENVDARFVEETALKQTLILLGFDKK
uniref:Gamma-secretase-activating protein C-terminal domain-containing protein n=1 Tax=Gouania willdenowi TaxID=441366 RepID=A0A8C5DGG8_GOUWI